MLRSRLELELAPRCMGAMLILLLSALMAITATILMPARRTGTTDRRGSSAECSSALAPGIAATGMAIAATGTAIGAGIMDDLFTGTDTLDTAMAMDILVTDMGAPVMAAADTGEGPPLEADLLVATVGAFMEVAAVAASTAVAVVDSTAAAVAASTAVADTGNSFRS